MICSLCNQKVYKIKELNQDIVVCEDCYNELFRFSKIKRKPIEYVYGRFGMLIKKIRLNSGKF